MDFTTPVLIVGGGPIGLAPAADLGRRGIAATLVEQGPGSGALVAARRAADWDA